MIAIITLNDSMFEYRPPDVVLLIRNKTTTDKSLMRLGVKNRIHSRFDLVSVYSVILLGEP